jgi:Na+/citrate or Na+/malate symporter
LEVKLDLLTRIQTLFILALGAGIGIIPMTWQFEHVMRISSEYSADEEFISVTAQQNKLQIFAAFVLLR